MTAENPLRAKVETYKARFDPSSRREFADTLTVGHRVEFGVIGVTERRNGILSYKNQPLKDRIKRAMTKGVR